MNFLKTSFYSSISTSISLIAKLITTKIIAIYLSTEGMFLLGQLKDFLNLSKTISTVGISNGIIKYTAEYKEDKKNFNKIIATGFRIHLVFSLLVFALTYIFNDWLSNYLFKSSEYTTYLVLLAFSTLSVSFHMLFMSILNGIRKIKLYITINIIATLLSAIVLVYLVVNYKTIGAFYAFLINQLITFTVSLILILLYTPFQLKNLLQVKYDSTSFNKLIKYSVMAITGPLCLILATFFIRDFISTEINRAHSGAWEGLWRMSAMYLLFLTTTLKFYLIPTFSTLSGKKLRKEVFHIWKHIIPIILAIALVVFLLKDYIITLFLSKEFLLISSLIGFQLLGDTFKINCWVLGNILISKAKTKAFILFQIEWALVFCSMSFLLVKTYGFIGVAIAYFIAYLVHFILLNIYFKNLLWIKSK